MPAALMLDTGRSSKGVDQERKWLDLAGTLTPVS